MSYVITKQPDGDISFGSKNAELVTLSDSPSDYPTGGYAFVGGEAFNANPSLTINVDLWRIDTVQPWGGQGGLVPVWNFGTQKLQIYETNASGAPGGELSNGADVSGYLFLLCVIGL
jgi:hypothetical protein